MSLVPFYTQSDGYHQSKVALARIAKFLDEDEVPDQVSSIKHTSTTTSALQTGLGIENASFKWNEVEEEDEQTKKISHAPDSSATSGTTLADTDETDHKFELRDLSVMFPEGALSLITGPTASGKTALLVRA